jgi:hypothetical protein
MTGLFVLTVIRFSQSEVPTVESVRLFKSMAALNVAATAMKSPPLTPGHSYSIPEAGIKVCCDGPVPSEDSFYAVKCNVRGTEFILRSDWSEPAAMIEVWESGQWLLNGSYVGDFMDDRQDVAENQAISAMAYHIRRKFKDWTSRDLRLSLLHQMTSRHPSSNREHGKGQL